MRLSLAILVIAVVTVPSVAMAQERTPESPPGRLLIVNNNLQEAFVASDVADPSDLANFVRRLLDQTTYAPDALLLQEVVNSSAQTVARLMSESTGWTYQVVVAPGESVYQPSGENEQIIRDTAIVINTGTLEAVGEAGFMRSTYAAEDGLSGEPVRTKEHAFAAARVIGESATKVPLMSLHFVPTRNAFPDDETSWAYKDRWVDEIARFFDETYPAPRWNTPFLAGDFNNRRCVSVDETRSCDTLAFWDSLTSTHGYSDAIFHGGSEDEIGTRKRIDYMFGRFGSLTAASDLSYGSAERSDPAVFYSDHRLMWALVDLE